jgi:FtsP/CotA-like multicopper oxidase with cupredoxin domain
MKTEHTLQRCHAGRASNANVMRQNVQLMKKAAVALAVAGLFAAGSAHAKFDAPTGGNPSPLFGAQPFTQKMLMFEEFGTQPLPVNAPPHSLPDPQSCKGAVDYEAYNAPFDTFLSQPLYPAPQRTANTSQPNPWAATISACLGRPVTGVAEGRPPGEDFAHQRWDEFAPEVYFQTALGCSRENGGMRDPLQMHHYQLGEFGPGGLYHNTVGAPGFDGTTKGIRIKFHPNMPEQSAEHLWTFDGTLPPKLLMAQYGKTILFRNYNALPIDVSYNGGHGMHTITTHEHNGHNPAESDGFAGAYFYPGQYYDYRWPMVLAGNDAVPLDPTNTVEKNLKSGTPDGNGGITKIPGDWHETMSTHWFHDHMVDYTAQNVYKGNAVMMNYYSAIDRGREPANAAEAAGSADKPGYGCNYADPTNVNPNNINLCLPSGSGLDWGNRDYDVNLVLADKAFDASGQLWYNTFVTDGFLGDVMTVNFLYKPYLDVRARKYRFRILNGAVSRYMKIAMVDEAGKQVPFHMIANDGNIMEHAVPFPNVQSPEGLPEQSIAERYDIIVDFSQFAPGSKLYLVNLLEHQNGKTPKQEVPLAQVLNGAYSAGGCPDNCDPAVGKFMEIRVHEYNGTDLSMNPADYVEGKKKMIPLPGFTPQELANAKERTFSFNRGGDVAPWTISTDGGASYNATSVEGLFDRISAAPEKESVEIWHIKNGGGGWSHPVHVHFEEGQILQRGGKAPPMWEKGARKDMYRIGPLPTSTDSVDLAIRVRDFLGTYVEHCHNTTHEDHAMLLRWDSQNPGQTVAIRTPYPGWDGVNYVDSNTTDVPTYKTGKQTDFLTKVAAPVASNDTASTTVNTAVTISVLANDTCVGACQISLLTSATHGTVTANADGTMTYMPATGYTGNDSFSYWVEDTAVGHRSNSASVNIRVGEAPAQPVPVPANDTAVALQSSVKAIDVTVNDANCSTVTPCSVQIVIPPAHGSVVANVPQNGMVEYTPGGVFTGPDSFAYRATNASGTSSISATVNMSVVPNPVMDVVTISGANLTQGHLSVSGAVSEQNGAFAAHVEVSAGACPGTSLGTANVDATGHWLFGTNVVAPVTTVCAVSANGGITQTPVTVASATAPVISSTPTLTGMYGKSYAYKVTASDLDGGPLTFSLDNAPVGMTLKSPTANSVWLGWFPTSTQGGLHDVTVRVTDPTGLFTTQSFQVDVAYQTHQPVVVNDAYTMIKGGTLNVAAPGVLANDTDPQVGDTLTATKYKAPAAGTFTGNPDGSFSFTPPADFTGMTRFSYVAKDNTGLNSSSAGYVSIAVRANRAPVTTDDTVSTTANTGLVIDVLGNDSDSDTVIDAANRIDPATVFITTAGNPNQGGTATVNANGTLSYTPQAGFTGIETFKYAVKDTYSTPGISRVTTVQVNVQ